MEEKAEKQILNNTENTNTQDNKQNNGQKTPEPKKESDSKTFSSNFFQNDILNTPVISTPTKKGPIVVKKAATPKIIKTPQHVKLSDIISSPPTTVLQQPKVTVIAKKITAPPIEKPKETINLQASAKLNSVASFLKDEEPKVVPQHIQPSVKSFHQHPTIIKFNDDSNSKVRVIKTQQPIIPISTQQPIVVATSLPQIPVSNVLSLNTMINPQIPQHFIPIQDPQQFIALQNPTQHPNMIMTMQPIIKTQIQQPPIARAVPQTVLINTTHQPEMMKVIQKEPEPAAPFPELPTQEEVLEVIDETEKEIERLQSIVQSLEEERELLMISVPQVSEAPVKSQIYDFHNNLYAKLNQPDIIARNRELIRKSHQKQELPMKDITRQRFRHISQLPLYMEEVENNDEYIEPIVQTIVQKNKQIEIKGRQLAQEYARRKAVWNKSNKDLEDYSYEMHEKIDIWPHEFLKSLIKPTEVSCAPFAAKDEMMRMYLDPEEREAMLFYNENGFVEDPIAEHEEYKRRVTWTEQETQIFREKYAQHPKEFKKIAAALPLKSIKDTIEFYFINRRKLDLKATEKRKGRQKIVSEGKH